MENLEGNITTHKKQPDKPPLVLKFVNFELLKGECSEWPWVSLIICFQQEDNSFHRQKKLFEMNFFKRKILL